MGRWPLGCFPLQWGGHRGPGVGGARVDQGHEVEALRGAAVAGLATGDGRCSSRLDTHDDADAVGVLGELDPLAPVAEAQVLA